MDANGTKQHLVFAILGFLEQQIASPELDPESKESLEVAAQCLQSAYGVSLQDENISAKFPLPASLVDIFAAGLRDLQLPRASAADKDLAERLKSEGNELLKQDKFQDAIASYTKAIAIDGRNAVYFCNRAAAHSKLGNHQCCLSDCLRALELDPNYSKAYSRKGLAHTSLGQHREARECFRKALELDPVNSGYRENLGLAEQSLNEQSSTFSAPGGGANLGFGGVNFPQFLNNPTLMNMATTILANPQMQSMMTNMMSSVSGDQSRAGSASVTNLLQAGQQIAQELNASNPELVEQLRAQRAQMTNQNSSSTEHKESPQ